VEFDLKLRLAVYRYFADKGGSPTLREMSDSLGVQSEEIRQGYKRLHAQRLLVPSEDGESIRMAPPFSGVETQHRVHVSGRAYFANCAWDSFGIVAALGGTGTVSSRCESSRDPLFLSITPSGPPPSSWLFHVVVPAASWWEDIVFT
jgi:Alkylmercury lyase